MSAYKVTEASINLHAGILVLDPSQAEPRKHRLTALGGNRYEVSNPPVMFKRGEVFELHGRLPKGIGQDVEVAEALAVPPPKPKPKSKT